MSQLRQKCLLGFFSQYFSPVTRFAPGRCTNPINRKPMAPPGQIKTPPPPLHHTPPASSPHTHTQTHTATQKPLSMLSAAPADLSEPYKDNSCSPSTYIDMNNDNNGPSKTIVNDNWGDKGTCKVHTVACLVKTKRESVWHRDVDSFIPFRSANITQQKMSDIKNTVPFRICESI